MSNETEDMISKIEKQMNQTLRNLGLTDWKAVWNPDHTRKNRGECLADMRIIMIYDEEPEAAMETLIHEFLEMKLRHVISPYREVINSLIEAIEKITYQQKESFIEDLIPLLRSNIQSASERDCLENTL